MAPETSNAIITAPDPRSWSRPPIERATPAGRTPATVWVGKAAVTSIPAAATA